MAFGRKKQQSPPTIEQLIARHLRLGEELLRRSAKVGRFEADIRLATMATAHANLAVAYLLQQQAAVTPAWAAALTRVATAEDSDPEVDAGDEAEQEQAEA